MKRRTLLLLFVALVSMKMSAQRRIMIGSTEYPVDSIADITFANVRTTVGDILANHKDYSIFHEALEKTGLVDTLGHRTTGKSYTVEDPVNSYGDLLYYPDTCRVKFTLFAEKDEVFKQAGINSFSELAAKCTEWYKNASQWYDYLKENGITISTGTDYTNRFNVVNMFVAYHILKGGMPVNELTYEKNSRTSSYWNVCFGYEPQEYYETLLPHTLLKVWDVNPQASAPSLYINRYRQNNTLTDEIGTFGSDATHPIIFAGVPINRSSSIEAYNGYIHSISSILKYDENAVKSQCERMRFDVRNILPELADNDLRYATTTDIEWMDLSTQDYTRAALPTDYFQNIRCYNTTTNLIYCALNAWRALNSTQLQGWKDYDLAIKLPSVPTGEYEIRLPFFPSARGSKLQFYIGTSSDPSSMVPCGNPFDATEDPTTAGNSYGCEQIHTAYEEGYENTDYGVASDKTMREKGYMRAPASYARATYNTITSKLAYDPTDIYSAAKNMLGSTSVRSEWGYGTMCLRKIVTTQALEQGKDYWLRFKSTNADATNNLWYLDYIEIVPTSITNSQTMTEDWY